MAKKKAATAAAATKAVTRNEEEESFEEYLGDVAGNNIIALLHSLTRVNKSVNSIQIVADAVAHREVSMMVFLTRDKKFVKLELDLERE